MTGGANGVPPVGVGIGAAAAVGRPAVGVGSIFHGTGVGVDCASRVMGAAWGPHAQATNAYRMPISHRALIPESTLPSRSHATGEPMGWAVAGTSAAAPSRL
jgi:hypothetical protein